MQHTLMDGSVVAVEWLGGRSAHYQITGASGETLTDGTDLHPGPLTENESEVMASLLAFLGHDGELYEFSPDGSWGAMYPNSADAPDESEYLFGRDIAAWVDVHKYELQNYATDLEG